MQCLDEARHDILAQAKSAPKRRFLWVGNSTFASNLRRNGNIDVTEQSGEIQGQYDVIVIDCAFAENEADARAFLSRYRDLSGAKIIVLNQQQWLKAQDFIELGFIRLDDKGYLFGFDLYNYRQTPDWLNAEHWANPTRFDKERW